MYNARQPQAVIDGIVPSTVKGRNLATHKQIEDIIETSCMNTNSESIYKFQKTGSAVHINVINMPEGNKSYIIANNAEGTVDVIELSNRTLYK